MLLHRAPLIVPVSQPPIEDGAILAENGQIVAVGSYADLKGQGDLTEHDGVVLTPALINCHTHLELSHLTEISNSGPWQGDITDWVSKLLALRERMHLENVLSVARKALDELYHDGVALVADIGNLASSAEIGVGASAGVDFYLEILGLGQAAVVGGLQRIAELDMMDTNCTGHAPYSTNKRLLIALKEKARHDGSLFPIHTAESQAELQFLADGSGSFRSFLEERGGWDNSFVPPGCGSVDYLDRLGLLDAATLCVHCVHVSDDEIELMVERRAKVCLCPGSNRFLGVGVAPVEKMVAAGILPGLGTDSLASNPLLNIWHEMTLLREDHPGLDPADVFAFATRGGAQSLHAPRFGSLSPGKSAAILAVRAEGLTPQNIYEYLTTLGQDAVVQWLAGGEG